MDVIHDASMDETHGTYVDDDDTNDDADGDTDGGGRGNLYTIKVPGGKLV